MSDRQTITDAERAEMTERLAQAHASFLELAHDLDAQAWMSRIDPESWSPSEIIQHTLLAEKGLMRRVREHQLDVPTEDWVTAIAGKEETLRRVLPGQGKAKSGPTLSTFTGLDRGQVCAALEASRLEFAALLDETAMRPLKAILLPQGFFGVLSGYLLLLYVPLHTERHLGQFTRAVTVATTPRT